MNTDGGDEAIKSINKLIESCSAEGQELAKISRHLGNGEVLLDLVRFITKQSIETKVIFEPFLRELMNKYKPSWIE